MRFEALLDNRLVFLDRSFASYTDIIAFAADRMADVTGLPRQVVHDALTKREGLGTTFLGHRLALPHGYVDGIRDIVVLFIRLPGPMAVTAQERSETVRYVFAILSSKAKAQLYLKVLSAIAQLVVNASHLLDGATSPEALIQSIGSRQITVDEQVTARDLISCFVTVQADATVAAAVDLMGRHEITLLPVVDGAGVLQGIVDLADLFRATLPEGAGGADGLGLLSDVSDTRSIIIEPLRAFWENEEKRRVRDVMRAADTYVVEESAGYRAAVLLMTAHHHRYLVVVGPGNVARGVIDTSDLIRKAIRP